jgi:hypothetical protein
VVIVFLVGVLALGASMAIPPSSPSLAMQDPSPTPPSGLARAFCPADQEIPFDNETIFEPTADTVGAATILDFPNPDAILGTPTTGKLYLTYVTLDAGECILGSYFNPGVVLSVRSGTIEIFIEHWPGNGAAPSAFIRYATATSSDSLAIEVATPVAANDWVRIENESFVGFKNIGDGPAVFVVAGLKPDGDPSGGGCGGGCRGRP